MGGGGGPEYLKLARRLLVIIGIGHGERARRRKLPAQQRHPTRLVKREIVLLHPGGGQQGGDGPLVHVGILPEVERGEMKAEGLDRADQPPQRASGRDRKSTRLNSSH